MNINLFCLASSDISLINRTIVWLIINSYSSRTGHIWADIYITNEAAGRVGYYQLIPGKSEKNNCFSKFSSNSLDFIGWNLRKSWHFLYRRRRENFFSDQHKKFAISLIIWSNLTIMALMMGLGNQSESWKSLSWAKNLLSISNLKS